MKKKAKICFLNYPNNPTGAHGDDGLYEKAIEIARANDILICHDAAYSEVTYDGYRRRASSSSTGRSATPSSSSPSPRPTA